MTQTTGSPAIQDSPSWTRLILDSIADGVFTVDKQGRITSFNRAAERITGFPKDEAIGQYCHEIFRANTCFEACPLKHTAETAETIINLEVNILNRDNKEIPISISTAVVTDESGNVVGAVETFRDLSLIKELHKEIYRQYSFQDILGRSKPMLKLFQILPDIAQSDATVLIEGESGTGKELFATALHNLSSRQDKPLIKVNCAALPETLLESELFGYKKGAFTDAKKDKPGRFRQAHGGTIFLDEIGDMSKGTQVKLLRVLEQKEYEPLGSTKTEKVDVRIIAATNRDLMEMMHRREFREDLFFRINVIRLSIPPLRERREDIPLLLDHFIERINLKQSKQIKKASPTALKTLLNYEFPGNVRELENVIEHATILTKGIEIQPRHLPSYLTRRDKEPRGPADLRDKEDLAVLDNIERDLIIRVLEHHSGSTAAAAKELGIHRSTLWRKMKRYGLLPQ
ncbi:MAG: sigma 54-interacting transcriptional regulator [Deltaproteobacteria bacterium]|nr:MAG: sigma 54-interacting transcriptional regulator [Deltaproteobacteria bacterium]